RSGRAGRCFGTRIQKKDHGTANFGIREIGHASARRHAAMAIDGGTDHAIEALLEPWYPRRAIPDLRCTSDPGRVTFRALRVNNLLAGARDGRATPVDGLTPVAARLVDHVGDGPLDFEFANIRIAAVRRHLASTIESSLRQPVKAL